MNFTNKYNLPDALCKAVSWSPQEVEYQYRVSELVNPPRIVWLTRRHGSEIEEDVSGRIWALLGSATHYILEKGQGRNDLAEEVLLAEVNGFGIKGRPDLLQGDTLWDYKVTSVWSVVYNPKGKGEWQAQLNVYRWLYEQQGFHPENLKVCAILRDWQKSKRGNDYPPVNAVVIDIPIWSNPYEYILHQVALLEGTKDLPDDKLPLCSDEERWQQPDKWALMKKGQKRAVKLYNSLQEAESACGVGNFIEARPGVSKRCLEYCNVRPWCEFGNKIKEGNDENRDNQT